MLRFSYLALCAAALLILPSSHGFVSPSTLGRGLPLRIPKRGKVLMQATEDLWLTPELEKDVRQFSMVPDAKLRWGAPEPPSAPSRPGIAPDHLFYLSRPCHCPSGLLTPPLAGRTEFARFVAGA